MCRSATEDRVSAPKPVDGGSLRTTHSRCSRCTAASTLSVISARPGINEQHTVAPNRDDDVGAGAEERVDVAANRQDLDLAGRRRLDHRRTRELRRLHAGRPRRPRVAPLLRGKRQRHHQRCDRGSAACGNRSRRHLLSGPRPPCDRGIFDRISGYMLAAPAITTSSGML